MHTAEDYRDMSFKGMAERRGYIVDEIEVISADNQYRLPLHRLRKNHPVGPPVLFVPPMYGVSQIYALDNEDESIAYILLNCGFDVWLANIRGSDFGKLKTDGTYANPNSFQDYDHTVTDYALYDIPVQIDAVLTRTNSTKLGIIGWAQGTTITLHMLALKPNYNDKIFAFAALAPMLTTKYITQKTLRAYLTLIAPTRLSPYMPFQALFARDMFFNQMTTSLSKIATGIKYDINYWSLTGILRYIITSLASLIMPKKFCVYFVDLILSTGRCIDPMLWSVRSFKFQERFPLYWHLFHSVACQSNFNFYNRMLYVDSFENITAFDYRHYGSELGLKLNLKHYKQEKPPRIVLKNINVPIEIYHASEDMFCTQREVDELTKALANSKVSKYFIENKEFRHFQFLMSTIDDNKVMYRRIAEFLHASYK